MQLRVRTNLESHRKWMELYKEDFKHQVLADTDIIIRRFASDIAKESPAGVKGTYQDVKTQVNSGTGHVIAIGKAWIEGAHVEATEYGFKPHGFSINNLLAWVIKVKGVSNVVQAKKEAFAIMKHLSRVGYIGHKIFEKITDRYKDIAKRIYLEGLNSRFGGK